MNQTFVVLKIILITPFKKLIKLTKINYFKNVIVIFEYRYINTCLMFNLYLQKRKHLRIKISVINILIYIGYFCKTIHHKIK